MRARGRIIAIEFPTAYATDAEDYLRQGLSARRHVSRRPASHVYPGPTRLHTRLPTARSARIVTLAENSTCRLHMHVHETAHEVAESLAQHGVRPLARLDRLGLVSGAPDCPCTAVHLDDTEIALLAQRGASVAHCPSSNLKLASGRCPSRQH